ncbi:conserved hypothetical protein [Vibrio nigripulchritudo SFn27]|uniref:Cytoplasmic protein n=1 Tax=Vibrio nigripulchritudo TaxID=28173 RepID=U4K1E0_9VIBR|nr:DUF2170 family protein [Vibrio nigripulchritudo]CCN80519.1 conserved hypothetical protein [Vibrio nigripulchritudo BLFn1]CCN89984.1 conserved hypothetical protein [Vibrio nigripulchritudo SFn27]CCN93659.1 conserved hypothetical protein [Vibrio nigripulchritudo ENn2]CCO42031.1 conserved hypothetical protein [Vibrio nigripulchritudo SFn135]CCO55020.1 conserved hypothetical protein [Vibrio nigripulchritudo Wn13]
MSWTLEDLQALIDSRRGWEVDSVDSGTLIINNSEDSLIAYLTVSEQQIVVESILFPEQNVHDVDALNREILQTHKLIPLTNIGVNRVDEVNYYVAYGALSSQAKDKSIIIEIATLFRNAETFIDMYNHHLAY